MRIWNLPMSTLVPKTALLSKATLIVTLVCVHQNSYSEIFKWVDENGKVHYSDQPHPDDEQKSEKVEIKDPNSFETKKSQTYYRRELSRKNTQNHNKQNQLSPEQCKAAQEEYTELTTAKRRGRVIESKALVQDGKTMSRRAQNNLAEKYRIKMNKQGCNIAQTENMKL